MDGYTTADIGSPATLADASIGLTSGDLKSNTLSGLKHSQPVNS